MDRVFESGRAKRGEGGAHICPLKINKKLQILALIRSVTIALRIGQFQLWATPISLYGECSNSSYDGFRVTIS